MLVTVKIPSQLRAVAGGEAELEVEGATVGEALDAVFDEHEALRERLIADDGLRRFVNVYVSGEDIRFQDGLDTQVSDGDEVTILPAVAGGGPRGRGREEGAHSTGGPGGRRSGCLSGGGREAPQAQARRCQGSGAQQHLSGCLLGAATAPASLYRPGHRDRAPRERWRAGGKPGDQRRALQDAGEARAVRR